ncbi:5-formyltetrahydrofolate cyclo-ligase [Paenibacillus anaericanus]|uniref:5-formyltetrahydrofolate cyclo-ligase n=1 Tax=Paenibacillus anaericanus TaxID=170367 RepID=UPI00277F7A41|nr:5-formyltetrahydrofolate cyclo-ligase [Paenibacillus anaericanus]MDQ0087385.1 5-formyltetrahydrofolate cyclo-ligase [Paenibacillus anaericanus]
MDIADLKQTLRHQMIDTRSRVTESSRREQSEEACLRAEHEVLGPLRELRGGRLTVFSYVSFRDEPDTRYFIQNSLIRGDRVLVPKIAPNASLVLHEYVDVQSLVPGVWGILEPGEDAAVWPVSRWNEIDVVLVPGLAFDDQGGRIGFGGGYYDRFIAKLRDLGHNHTKLAALALKEQFIARDIPMEDHDFRLDMLFTASGVIYRKESSE